jgi:hypothetical protein
MAKLSMWVALMPLHIHLHGMEFIGVQKQIQNF